MERKTTTRMGEVVWGDVHEAENGENGTARPLDKLCYKTVTHGRAMSEQKLETILFAI